MVFYVVKYVTWLLKFTYWLILNCANAPGPSGDRGEMAMASLVHQMLSFLLCTFSRSLELPATTEGEAVERQPLARTQGRNLDRGLTFEPTPCVGCLLLTSRGRDLMSEGHRLQDRRARLSACCSRSMLQDVWPMEHSCRWLTDCAARPRATTREPTRRPQG